MENIISPIFNTYVPISDFEFERSPLLSTLFSILDKMRIDVVQIFLNAIINPRISLMRNQHEFCTLSADNQQILPVLSIIQKSSIFDLYSMVLAASIITNVSPSDVVHLSHVEMSKTEIDIINLSLNTIYQPEPTIIFQSDGKFTVINARPIIPPTFVRYFNSRELIFSHKIPLSNMLMNGVSRDRLLESCNQEHNFPKMDQKSEISSELINAPGFFSSDLSNGYNKRNGLPDVACYNDIDSEAPVIMRWIGNLTYPRFYSCSKIGCPNNKCQNCQKFHQRKMTDDGRKSLIYQDNGRINIEDLRNHCPVIFECSFQCCCSPETCKNRVIQKRWSWNLIVIRTNRTFGWTVRTMDFIPKGSFVCEMLGRIIFNPIELEKTIKGKCANSSFLYNLDAYHVPAGSMLVLDTREQGNVSSYIEPTGFPNLFPVSVCDNESLACHHIALFAFRDIYPNEDISFHPNYAFNWAKQLAKNSK